MMLPHVPEPCQSMATDHMQCLQLPVYLPDLEERQDATLYAANVRDYMVMSSPQYPYGLLPLHRSSRWVQCFEWLLKLSVFHVRSCGTRA